jgi:tetratricopeptide (TPR) repeat protein
VQDFTEVLKLTPHDADALNSRCWSRTLGNQELEAAVADCDEALRVKPGTAAYLDSRALAWLRTGQFDKAIQDATAALAADPEMVSALYARGIARRRLGNEKAGDADLAAARSASPGVVQKFNGYGIHP